MKFGEQGVCPAGEPISGDEKMVGRKTTTRSSTYFPSEF